MDYKFCINDFEGPLDLLLHLVKTSKMDIYEIDIKIIIEEYLEFINLEKERSIDIASSYLVMAAELIHLKSRMLVNDDSSRNSDEEFHIESEEDLKRKIIEYENLEEFKEKTKGAKMYLLSTKSKKCYTDVEYEDEAYLVFGPETRGLPEDFILENFDNAARIPMRDIIRSLNLSNAVAIVAYEAERQLRYKNLLEQSPYFDEKLK